MKRLIVCQAQKTDSVEDWQSVDTGSTAGRSCEDGGGKHAIAAETGSVGGGGEEGGKCST